MPNFNNKSNNILTPMELGIQFEGSKDFGVLPTGTVLNTIFRTGNDVVEFRKRVVSYTGTGIRAEIYEAPTFTGGVVETYQNSSNLTTKVGGVQIIVAVTLTSDGTLAFMPVNAFGNASNQGKGGILSLVEEPHLLKPNTDYLLRLISTDAGSQQIASHIIWVERD